MTKKKTHYIQWLTEPMALHPTHTCTEHCLTLKQLLAIRPDLEAIDEPEQPIEHEMAKPGDDPIDPDTLIDQPSPEPDA